VFDKLHEGEHKMNTNQGVISLSVVDLKVEEIKFTVDEFIDDLEMYLFENSIEAIKITEDFSKNGKRSYVLCGLQMEVSEGYFIASDRNDILRENLYVFMMFLESFALSIKRFDCNGITHGEIKFADGNIMVEVA